MSGPTQRILAVLELLQSHGHISGAAIARTLAVDARTVRRDIVRLQAMGIPVTSTPGRDGAYALVAGFKLPPLLFDDDEALALALGLRAVRGMGLAAVPAASALAKLERAMPGGLRKRVGALDETVALEMARPVAPFDATLLALFSAAAQQGRRVAFDYRSPQGEHSGRHFDCYGLAWRAGRWYAVGHCHLRRALRSFRLDRVLQARPIDAAFARPAGFDALDYLRTSIAGLPRAHGIVVRLQTDLASAQAALFAAFCLLAPAPDGDVLLHAQADDLDWFARELARLPFAFAILTPDALRHALARHAARLQRMGAD